MLHKWLLASDTLFWNKILLELHPFIVDKIYTVSLNVPLEIIYPLLKCREWPGRRFQPRSKSEYLDVLFAGRRNEPSIICLHVQN